VIMRHLVFVILCGRLSGMQGGINVQTDKYKFTKNKLCTKLVLFTRLYRDARSTKYKMEYECWKLQISVPIPEIAGS
jgi:hypothetical protein